jgi:hypothetical protein
MKTLNVEFEKHDINQFNDGELELVSGGARTLFESLHRLLFAGSCVATGNTLEVHGDQLWCR